MAGIDCGYAADAESFVESWFSPTRKGETTRKCENCGAEYIPRSRNQKYCTTKCKDAKRKASL